MYGMVNRAIQDHVHRCHGEAMWARVKERAGVDIDVFIRNEAYPDELSYCLVGAAAAEMGVAAEEVLHEFGIFWVLHTAREGYGDLMAAAGSSLPEFLQYLPNFHDRVALIYPNLKPPQFDYSNAGPDRITVHYHSHRTGLAPFVVGLLHGLGRMYETPVTVEHTVRRADGADHDEFLVTWSAPAGA